jgi:hypothetical protein
MAQTTMRETAGLSLGLVIVHCGSLLALLLGTPFLAAADEAGISFWLPGQFGSFAATPSEPGWSFENTFYHATAAASVGASFERSGEIEAGIKSPSDFFMFTPTYAFATPVLGGQAAVGMTALYGKNATSVFATLAGTDMETQSGGRADHVTGFGDLYPSASLKWNWDVHNLMVYGTGGIPVGTYQPTRLSSLGIGHWAADGGAGYTYFNERAGFEWTAVVGFTYNFINPYTEYRSGIDGHLDWAVSPYVSDKMHVGLVGYVYEQLSGDSGPGARLGDFKSRVSAIGPQIGFFPPFGAYEGYLNLRGYYEFDAKNRLEGWNTYLTFSVEPAEKAKRR